MGRVAALGAGGGVRGHQLFGEYRALSVAFEIPGVRHRRRFARAGNILRNFRPRSKVREAVNALLAAREFSFTSVGHKSLIQVTQAVPRVPAIQKIETH